MSERMTQCPDHKLTTTQGSNSYSFNEDKGVGFCLSCGLTTWKSEDGKLWGRHSKRQKPVLIEDSGEAGGLPREEQEVEEYGDWGGPTVDYLYLPSRGITKDTKQFFDIRTYPQVKSKVQHPKTKEWYEFVSDEEHAVYPNGSVKGRRLDLPKDHWAHFFARGSLDCFFAQNLFPAGCSKKLTIVEGDTYDTPSAYQMLNKGNFLNPVVSVPGSKPVDRDWETI